ncbi:PqqD family protein [Actinomyces faecalis]|uniref:PqqD family protein n=1 Tax=Actinomyces faecalis TaxID=2722820 RepID=UPI001556BF85|nr:PqqD family protein [Actinomyces faecalis]
MTYVPCRRVAHIEDCGPEPVVYVAHVPDGSPVVLEGSAALIWQAAVGQPRPGDAMEVTLRVSEKVGIPAEQIQGDVSEFLAQLIGDGYLEVV